MNRKFGSALIGLLVVFLTACNGPLGGQVASSPPPSASASASSIYVQDQFRTSSSFFDAVRSHYLTATQKLAVETCGAPTLASCQTKGEAVFQSIPVASQGDASVNTSPAGFARELREITDVTQLDHAVQLVNTLIGFKQQNDAGVPADQSALAAQIHGVFPNATQADVNVGSTGTAAVDFTANTEERGIAAFSTRTLKSAAEVGAWLNENTPQSMAAKANVEASIRAAGFGDDEVQRALSGVGYFPIQPKGASQVLGTSYFQAGKVLVSNDWRQAGPGDIYWFFLTKSGSLIVGATVRADCGNPNVQQILLIRPGMPSVPSVEQPPTTPPVHDECTNVPGNQPLGYPCSKVGQVGSIAAGNHDPLGGTPDPARNPTEPTADPRPVVTNPDTPGRVVEPAPTPTAPPAVVVVVPTTPLPTVAPSEQPVNTGVVDPVPTSTAAPCNPDFQSCP